MGRASLLLGRLALPERAQHPLQSCEQVRLALMGVVVGALVGALTGSLGAHPDRRPVCRAQDGGTGGLPQLVAGWGPRHDQGPEDLVFRIRGSGRRDAETGDARVAQVGVMSWRMLPHLEGRGKILGARSYVLHRNAGIVAYDARLKRPRDV